MNTKADKRLEGRAAQLLDEREKLRSKCNAIRQAVRAQTNAEIAKSARAFYAGAGGDPAELLSKIAGIFESERVALAEISTAKLPKKKKP